MFFICTNHHLAFCSLRENHNEHISRIEGKNPVLCKNLLSVLFHIRIFLRWTYIVMENRFVDPERQSLKGKEQTDAEQRDDD